VGGSIVMVKVDPGLGGSGSLGGSSGSGGSDGASGVDSSTGLRLGSSDDSAMEIDEGFSPAIADSMRNSRHSVGFSAVQDYTREGSYNDMRAYLVS
jgi:hypothetical protein